ncbi:hypothetical protein AC578_6629 [Pseudocercospora eumusae]|uniref:Uncharacterized protein n=1 Tax=Pseudocercospora eumusae TaxID=321146 RepID=A0A139HG24_9PEZI|nr:hypothetical protein AC578_6629 [Pseudocercospora eumusae]
MYFDVPTAFCAFRSWLALARLLLTADGLNSRPSRTISHFFLASQKRAGSNAILQLMHGDGRGPARAPRSCIFRTHIYHGGGNELVGVDMNDDRTFILSIQTHVRILKLRSTAIYCLGNYDLSRFSSLSFTFKTTSSAGRLKYTRLYLVSFCCSPGGFTTLCTLLLKIPAVNLTIASPKFTTQCPFKGFTYAHSSVSGRKTCNPPSRLNSTVTDPKSIEQFLGEIKDFVGGMEQGVARDSGNFGVSASTVEIEES